MGLTGAALDTVHQKGCIGNCIPSPIGGDMQTPFCCKAFCLDLENTSLETDGKDLLSVTCAARGSYPLSETHAQTPALSLEPDDSENADDDRK